ncbi:unnamed protein product [Angiostrongylus costaricensis]|uniref:OTU domain-containing protein n=1 Tax=Angiostrongylus costaricensis TaxID=334426 RepID=A0A0R3PR30_ANGCS|nr:unnamed protein product [Angiostrongylus costaricensis]
MSLKTKWDEVVILVNQEDIGDEMSARRKRAAKYPNWTRVTTVVTPVGQLSMDQSEHTSLQEFVESEILFQYRLQRIRTGLPTVNKTEDTLRTIARLLRIELHVYRAIGEQPFVYDGNPDVGESVEKVVVCESHRGHYDLVLTRKDHACLGYAQTFVYDLLYFNVFGFSRDVIKNCIKRIRDDMSKGNHPVDEVGMNVANQPTTSTQERTCGDGELSLNSDGLETRFGWRPPMPYCAVKSLDPSVYRNISYDIFLRERKRILKGSSSGPLHVGNRCVLMESASAATVSV